VNCEFLSNCLGINVRPDLGYFNGVEIQFTVKGNLNGYKVKVSRTKSYAIVVNGQVQRGNHPMVRILVIHLCQEIFIQ